MFAWKNHRKIMFKFLLFRGYVLFTKKLTGDAQNCLQIDSFLRCLEETPWCNWIYQISSHKTLVSWFQGVVKAFLNNLIKSSSMLGVESTLFTCINSIYQKTLPITRIAISLPLLFVVFLSICIALSKIKTLLFNFYCSST